MSKYYYAVRVGERPGIYQSWEECEVQVKGYKGAKYKKFKTLKEAEAYLRGEEILEPVKEEISLKDDEMIAYVDGSFSLEKMTFSYGIVLITNDKIETFKGKDDDKDLAEMRNVSGELKAAMLAMELALDRGVRKVYLHHDYNGIEKWALGQWKANKEGTKKYKEFYRKIRDKIEVEFIKVAAHTGIKYNEMADKLAKEALL